MESNNQQILPIDMVLFCPDCGKQHVDKIEPEVCQDCGHRSGDHFNAGERNVCGGGAPGDENDCKCTGFTAWLNPPHKSHRCHFCNHVWRPADVATNGVAEIKTHGENDSFPPAPENPRYRQKLVSRGWENPETLRAARDIAEMLTRMSLGQTKYFCQIVEQHVFPKMSQKEYE